jgi:hypothetical protein
VGGAALNYSGELFRQDCSFVLTQIVANEHDSEAQFALTRSKG